MRQVETQIEESGSALSVPSDAVQGYLEAALSENTRRAYRSDLKHFTDWGGTIPASDFMISEYLAAHAGKLAIATLQRRITTIAKAHTSQGLVSPTRSDLVRMTMRGIRRTHRCAQRRVAPILRDDIVAMVEDLGDGLKDLRDRALLLVGFAGAFRRSELIAIDCNDIEHVAEGIIVNIRISKTDQEGKGRQVAIPYAKGAVCPVLSLDAWLSAAEIAEGPVFRGVNRHEGVSGRTLSPEVVAIVVKERCGAIGLDPRNYSGHSLRAGLVTSAASADIPVWKIKEQTGHVSDSMVERYIRTDRLFVSNSVGTLL